MADDTPQEPMEGQGTLEVEPTSEMMLMESTTVVEDVPDAYDLLSSDSCVLDEQHQEQQVESQEVGQQEEEQQPLTQQEEEQQPSIQQQEKQQEVQNQQQTQRTETEIVVRPPASLVKPTKMTENDDNDDFVEDETALERIIALKEMFPESIRNAVGSLNQTMISGAKLAYTKGRTASWWLSSTMCVLVFPILIQKELLQVAEQISREQRSILLGPQAATGAVSGAVF